MAWMFSFSNLILLKSYHLVAVHESLQTVSDYSGASAASDILGR